MNNKNYKILDCTLRDGGYYTNWDFDTDLVKQYFENINNLPIEYLEIGYRSKPMTNYLGEYFYCPDYVLKQAKSLSHKKIVIILNEKDVRPEDAKKLLESVKDYIDMVRLAIDPQNFERALGLAKEVKSMGFEVGFNVMYMSNWKQYEGFLDLIPQVDGIADYFYMVDSFGGVYPEDVKEIFAILKEKTNVKIGFHGHNNLELGLINTFTAIECGADIVDATITGMGRGAGNLKMELLLTALNARKGLDLDFNSLAQLTDSFVQLQKEYDWGTSLPYMVSGANSLPQKDVMEWVTKRFYSFNSIIRALQNKKDNKKDNIKLPILKNKTSFKNALVIGGGPTAAKHAAAIKAWLMKNPQTILIFASSRNAQFFDDIKAASYFCLIGSEGHRLEKTFQQLNNFNGNCVLPPFPRPMGTYIPDVVLKQSYELNSYSDSAIAVDSATNLAVELALILKAENLYFAGYDGYSDELMGEKEKALFSENDQIIREYSQYFTEYCSVTPSKYDAFKVKSIYSILAS